MSRILVFHKIVPSYRVGIFRELYKRFNIITCHSMELKNSSWKSSWKEMDYPNELLKKVHYLKRDTSVVQNVFPVLKKYKPEIIISEFAIGYMTFWLLFLLKPFYKYKLVAWTHGIKNNEIDKPFKSIKSRIALFIYKKADGILLYSEFRKKIIEKRVREKEKIFVAANTLDTNELTEIYNGLKQQSKEVVKKRLNFKSEYNLIYSGRLLPSKRIDLILEAFKIVKKNTNIALHFIGEGPELKLINQYQKEVDDIYTYGGIYDNKITGDYLYASDMFIMPGYIGLSIVHGFCFGLPMVTCRATEEGPFHSPEIEYLKDKQNGLLCESTAESIAERIKIVIDDKKLLNKMSENALHTVVTECSLDKMMEGFKDLIQYLQK